MALGVVNLHTIEKSENIRASVHGKNFFPSSDFCTTRWSTGMSTGLSVKQLRSSCIRADGMCSFQVPRHMVRSREHLVVRLDWAWTFVHGNSHVICRLGMVDLVVSSQVSFVSCFVIAN